MTVPVVLAIAGVVALFLGIWGGQIKAKEIEIPAAPPKARAIVGFIGLVFVGIAIWLSIPSANNSGALSFEYPTSSIPTPTSITGIEATVSRSKVDEWSLGETTDANVQTCLNENGKISSPEIYVNKGETIPKGVLLATGFFVDGGAHWNQLPVKPICINNNDWGLFETTDEFQAVSPGGYRRIVP